MPKPFFRCSICNAEFPTSKEAQACEAQGSTRKFQTGQRIRVDFGQVKGILECVIHDFKGFTEITHTPGYLIKLVNQGGYDYVLEPNLEVVALLNVTEIPID